MQWSPVIIALIMSTIIVQASSMLTIQQQPLTCSGNTTSDAMSGGCRWITCQGTKGTSTIMACDKPSTANPTYFELYKKQATGTQPTICLGNTCITNEGYKRSPNQANTTPINSSTNATNTTNQTNRTDSFTLSTTITLTCTSAQGGELTHITIADDQGHQWFQDTGNTITLTLAPGNYTASCQVSTTDDAKAGFAPGTCRPPTGCILYSSTKSFSIGS